MVHIRRLSAPAVLCGLGKGGPTPNLRSGPQLSQTSLAKRPKKSHRPSQAAGGTGRLHPEARSF